MKTVLFVCTGNICRSPMAEGWLRYLVDDPNTVQVRSAGTSAMEGMPPSPHAVEALHECGVDITRQRSRRLTPELIREADWVFGMTQGHVEAIRALFPERADRVHRLLDFAHETGGDVADPIGGTLNQYRTCRDQIRNAVEALKSKLSGDSTGAPSTVVLGADHGGVGIKAVVREYLEKRGLTVADYGTDTTESTDYPDYADQVARAVALGRADFGVLVCNTGVGMSIAANKVPGVRAALVFNPDMARLARQHNHANVLCLGSLQTRPEDAPAILDAFLAARFEGGRHERRVNKIERIHRLNAANLEQIDPAIADVIRRETRRQQENIELIASENFVSPAVMEAAGSVLTNKYAEGYPGKRWYGGCEIVDEAETLAIERAKKLFGAGFANVQPHSGSGANMAVYFSVLQPGDRILTMDLSHGGHLTHGNKANFSGKFFEVIHYGVGREDERIDYDQLAALAREHKPRMITVGASAYPRVIDFERMGAIARENGAYMLADIAHIAGLVAAGLHPNPISHADFVTTTTHKTLRGPRGGLVLTRDEELGKKVNSMTFPGIQGGPLMHVIAAKAVCFEEALRPEFREYQAQIIRNAAALAQGLAQNGFRLVSGGTDNHLILVDVGARDLTGAECQHALDEAGITVNKNTIPFETRSPFKASGIRLGTPAVTTRGMLEADMTAIADMISEVLMDINSVDTAGKVRERVLELTAKFPLPY